MVFPQHLGRKVFEEHILDEHEHDVTDIDLLIAPDHGRKSGRSYKFRDTLRPNPGVFSETHPTSTWRTGAWSHRGLCKITD